MKNLKMSILLCTSLFLAVACNEEEVTRSQQSTTVNISDVETFEVSNRSLSRLDKPPVDILYVVDNSGSTLVDNFQALRSEIERTVNDVSSEFDFHIYFTPLIPASGDSITSYPLLVSDPNTLNGISNLNIVSAQNLSAFAPTSGNNVELGFQRALSLIENNRSNGIFRNNSNTIIVMISNGDDTGSRITIGGNQVTDPSRFATFETQFRNLTALSGSSSSLNADSLRFISLVAHQNCSFATAGTNYRLMSERIYNFQGFTDNNSARDSFDLCAGATSSLFSAVNSSIRQVLVGHRYDHWLISTSQNESSIASNDITLTRVNGVTGATTNIPRDETNGFTYLGFRSNQNTRFFPDAGEPATGLIVRLNGSARVEFPDFISASTRAPNEFFGFVPLPSEPDLTSVQVTINGATISQSSTNGWTFLGFREVLNTKVPGPTNASVEPAVNRTGYFLQLHGSAIYTNGDDIQVFFRAATR